MSAGDLLRAERSRPGISLFCLDGENGKRRRKEERILDYNRQVEEEDDNGVNERIEEEVGLVENRSIGAQVICCASSDVAEVFKAVEEGKREERKK